MLSSNLEIVLQKPSNGCNIVEPLAVANEFFVVYECAAAGTPALMLRGNLGNTAGMRSAACTRDAQRQEHALCTPTLRDLSAAGSPMPTDVPKHCDAPPGWHPMRPKVGNPNDTDTR
eukprot:CAMPEP_0198495426 /NCGR_PEP_ID=MMETSP1462-20131121/5202_1 /TAXON_ID=1333877 /ORGANISM="Brandtodinium nutriculum, Strain RCC3387" /LENGTH=116 /DNA_ID=CAMNT_0044224205 /DNA_START=202 /DNA_END=550 /DNA_ORIENTATION=-